MSRVQIPAYTDRWMMGDRFGEIVKITHRKGEGKRIAPNTVIAGPLVEIAHVKLDKSGKTIKVVLEDCTII